jgi:hypothetical protein
MPDNYKHIFLNGALKGDPSVTFSRIWPLVMLAEWNKG